MEYYGAEGSGFIVRINAAVGFLTTATVRLSIEFSGVASVRISDPNDRPIASDRPISIVEQSTWREQALADYVQQFGTKLLPAVSSIQHFVVRSRDQTVGVLARHMTIAEAP